MTVRQSRSGCHKHLAFASRLESRRLLRFFQIKFWPLDRGLSLDGTFLLMQNKLFLIQTQTHSVLDLAPSINF